MRITITRSILATNASYAIRSARTRRRIEYMLDFPRLLLCAPMRSKRKEHGKTLQQKLRDEITGDTDRSGKIAAVVPGIMNWAANNKIGRQALETIAGIDHRKKLPVYQKETFHSWWKKREVKKSSDSSFISHLSSLPEKVALFYTCMIDQNKPWIGEQYVKILEKFGIEVTIPEQECCGNRRSWEPGISKR